ncbi:MAG: DUF1778 domain-containing protein [Bryobacterales bacterium]|nr:DUF1778 domain-containing protein [Bryobacterales bacterium]
MTDFVLRSAKAAARPIEKRAILILTARETEAFEDTIPNPPDPGPVLRRASRAYNERAALRQQQRLVFWVRHCTKTCPPVLRPTCRGRRACQRG